MNPHVSVIVPVHNQERFIGRCLRSLIAQELPRQGFEIVVVDDGSTDRSAYAVDLFRDEVELVTLESQRGLPAALNAGLRRARGELVVRVDSDDYVNTRFLSLLSLILDENPDIDAVACDYLLVDNDEGVLGRGNADTAPIACGIMFRSADVHRLGLYDESFLAHEDLEFRHRYLSRHSIYRVPVALYRYRRHDTNMTNDTDLMSFFQERVEDKHGREEGLP